MPKQGPGTKFVLKGLKHALPDISEQHEQASRERQGPGTNLVLKGLKLALPDVAERYERDSRERDSRKRDSRERKRVSHKDDGKNRQEPSVSESRRNHNQSEDNTRASVAKRGDVIKSTSDDRKYHDQSEEHTRALVPYKGDDINRRSHREDMDRQEGADKRKTGQERVAQQKHAVKRQEHNGEMNRHEQTHQRRIGKEDRAQHQHTQLQRDDAAKGAREEGADNQTTADQASSTGSTRRPRQPSVRQDGLRHQNGASGGSSNMALLEKQHLRRAPLDVEGQRSRKTAHGQMRDEPRMQ